MKTFEITLYVRTSEYAEVTITAGDENEAIEQVEDMFRAGEISLQPTMYMDLSRFDAAPLIAFSATKETNYGTETDGRISR